MTLAEKVYLHSLARKEAAELVSKYAADAEDIAIGAGGAALGGLSIPALDKLRGIIQRYDKGAGNIRNLAERADWDIYNADNLAFKKTGAKINPLDPKYKQNAKKAEKLISLSRSKPAKLISKVMGKYHKLGKGGKAGAIAALAAMIGGGAYGISDALRKG